VCDDPAYLDWIGLIWFATSQYCPGLLRCVHGAYSPEIEALRVALRAVQEEQGWVGDFVINPMHVGMGEAVVRNPKHILIIGLFMDEGMDRGERMHNELTARGYTPHLYLYNRL
jgi:hypothetical protein